MYIYTYIYIYVYVYVYITYIYIYITYIYIQPLVRRNAHTSLLRPTKHTFFFNIKKFIFLKLKKINFLTTTYVTTPNGSTSPRVR